MALGADANPNLAPALGVSPESAALLRPVPASLVSRRRGGRGPLEPIDDVLDRHAVVGPDGVALLGMGAPQHADEGCLCSAHAVVSSLLEDLGGSHRVVIVDIEASPEHLSRGTVRHVDTVCLVAEPYYRSLETVRRMANLVAELPVQQVLVVANKVRAADEVAISEFCERHRFSLAAVVPWSDDVVAADAARVPLVDWPSGQPAVAAVTALLETLRSSRVEAVNS